MPLFIDRDLDVSGDGERAEEEQETKRRHGVPNLQRAGVVGYNSLLINGGAVDDARLDPCRHQAGKRVAGGQVRRHLHRREAVEDAHPAAVAVGGGCLP